MIDAKVLVVQRRTLNALASRDGEWLKVQSGELTAGR